MLIYNLQTGTYTGYHNIMRTATKHIYLNT